MLIGEIISWGGAFDLVNLQMVSNVWLVEEIFGASEARKSGYFS